MREVIPQELYIGNARDVHDIARIHDLGILAIIDLAFEEPPPQLSRDLIYCRFPIVDGENVPELLYTAVATTSNFIRMQIPLLIGCSAGMSRSPAILAASLALVRNQSPDDVLQSLIEGNPHDISSSLWADIKKVCKEMQDV